MIDSTLIGDYETSRDPRADRSVLCHAPFTSLNFDQHGRVRVCCYNWRARLGTWPEASLAELWSGAQAVALRQSFLEGTEARGCDLCFDQLRARNFKGALMRNFDQFSTADGYEPVLQPHAPRVVELELTNTCNLECVQCQAKWSSLIRKNRDHMAPLPMPYNDRFVEELEAFLPTLIEAKFLGGEPMLVRLYHLIWERIRAVNPHIVLSITTNGTVIPDRAFAALSGLRSHICLSIDSLDPGNYARIRRNASLDTVLANFARWREYTRACGTGTSMAVCPMVYNWRDLPEFLRFSAKHDVWVAFNTVIRPWRASLANLETSALAEVADYLASHGNLTTEMNRATWDSLVGQIRFWHETRRALDAAFPGFVTAVRAEARAHADLLGRPDDHDDSVELVSDALARLLASSWLTAEPSNRDLADRLRQMTPPDNAEDSLPAEQTTLLRTLVLFRNAGLLGAATPRMPAAAETSRLTREIDLVDRFIQARMTQADWNTMWDALPEWPVLDGWLDELLARAASDTA